MLSQEKREHSDLTKTVRIECTICSGENAERWQQGDPHVCALQFPDPHFKTKHKKRRVIQPQVVHTLERLMPPGGEHHQPLSITSSMNWAASCECVSFMWMCSFQSDSVALLGCVRPLAPLCTP